MSPEKNAKTIASFSFHAPRPGPALLVFGAVHGNEICGTEAIRKAISEIENGTLVLDKGSVTFVPVANPLAYAKKVRYIRENLNRIFKPTKKPHSDEARFANVLCALIDRCDAFLDIHSITAKGEAFLYLDFPTSANRAWAKIIGVKHAVVGWPELYRKMGRSEDAFDTTTYAARQGKRCLLIECGQHQSPTAPQIAYQAIINSLYHYGIIRGSPKAATMISHTMSEGYFRAHCDDCFTRNWKHLDMVQKNQPLIRQADGKILRAPYDATIIMPKATAPVGDDWLYLGKTGKG